MMNAKMGMTEKFRTTFIEMGVKWYGGNSCRLFHTRRIDTFFCYYDTFFLVFMAYESIQRVVIF